MKAGILGLLKDWSGAASFASVLLLGVTGAWWLRGELDDLRSSQKFNYDNLNACSSSHHNALWSVLELQRLRSPPKTYVKQLEHFQRSAQSGCRHLTATSPMILPVLLHLHIDAIKVRAESLVSPRAHLDRLQVSDTAVFWGDEDMVREELQASLPKTYPAQRVDEAIAQFREAQQQYDVHVVAVSFGQE